MDSILVELMENDCRKDIIDSFYQMSMENNKVGLILILSKYKQELKSLIHADGKLIDCIDYLIYNLERKI